MRKMFLLLSLSLLFFLTSNCAAPQTVTTPEKCPPEGYVIIKKDVLTDLMNACARTKSELNECLEREKVK